MLFCYFLPGGVDSHAGNISQLGGVLGGVTPDRVGLSGTFCRMHVYVGMLSSWPGVQGHEPPPQEQEASPRGQLLALKGPTHPWLNAPGLLCPRGCWLYRPIHTFAPQMEGGKEHDDLPYAEGAAARMHLNNVHINTRAPHARHVHLINLSSLPSRSCKRGSFVPVWPAESWKMSRTFCLLIGYWQQSLQLMLQACIERKRFLDYSDLLTLTCCIHTRHVRWRCIKCQLYFPSLFKQYTIKLCAPPIFFEISQQRYGTFCKCISRHGVGH